MGGVVQLFNCGPSPEEAAAINRQRLDLWTMARRIESAKLRQTTIEIAFATASEAGRFLEACAAVPKRRRPKKTMTAGRR